METGRPRRVSFPMSLFRALADSSAKTRTWRAGLGIGILALGFGLVSLASGSLQRRPAVHAPYLMEQSCTALSSIQTRLNSSAIPEGNFIWFNSAIRAEGLRAEPVSIFLNDSTISFAANGQ